MPSLRSILVFASVALAGFVTAAPTALVLKRLPEESTEIGARCNCRTVAEVLVNVQAEVQGISAKLNAVVVAAAGAKVDVSLISPYLYDIKSVIITAIVQVKAMVGVSAKVALGLNGKVITVAECASHVYAVLVLICGVLQVAIKVCLTVQISVCLAIIAEIGVSICEFLTVIFSIVVGLKASLSLIVAPLLSVLIKLKLKAVISLVGLPVL